MKIFPILIFILSPLFVNASSLCSKDEKTYFSCSVRGGSKTISLCGNEFWSIKDRKIKDDAWIQYRFGTTEKIELEYPATKANSIKKFEGEYHHPYVGFYYALWFKIGKTEYAVEHVEGDENFYGVSIKQNGKDIDIPCQGKPEVTLSDDGANDFFSLVSELSGEGR